jgi:hypothetical protein
MNQYTIFWTGAQQSAFLTACPFIDVENADFINSPEDGEYFALVQDLNNNQYEQVSQECQGQRILGIKPGSNPGGSPTGCA